MIAYQTSSKTYCLKGLCRGIFSLNAVFCSIATRGCFYVDLSITPYLTALSSVSLLIPLSTLHKTLSSSPQVKLSKLDENVRATFAYKIMRHESEPSEEARKEIEQRRQQKDEILRNLQRIEQLHQQKDKILRTIQNSTIEQSIDPRTFSAEVDQYCYQCKQFCQQEEDVLRSLQGRHK